MTTEETYSVVKWCPGRSYGECVSPLSYWFYFDSIYRDTDQMSAYKLAAALTKNNPFEVFALVAGKKIKYIFVGGEVYERQ